MEFFPRTYVGGVSLSRLIVGSNWFLGYSHYSHAKDLLIKSIQTRQKIADILEVFLKAGVDTVMGHYVPILIDAIDEAQQRTGQKIKLVLTPFFNILPGGSPENEPEKVIAQCKLAGATICMPHQVVTDMLIDRMYRKIRDIDKYTKLIRQYEMIPGLSTHMPEAVIYADETNADVETYVQLYNSEGFLMQFELDRVTKIIKEAEKPVITIKPLASGRLHPMAGLSFVWSTIRDQDMVTIGTINPIQAREVINISLELLEHRSYGIDFLSKDCLGEI